MQRPIKFQKALELSELKRLPHTFDFHLSNLPQSLVDSLTALQLAQVVTATFKSHRDGVKEGREMES